MTGIAIAVVTFVVYGVSEGFWKFDVSFHVRGSSKGRREADDGRILSRLGGEKDRSLEMNIHTWRWFGFGLVSDLVMGDADRSTWTKSLC